MKKLSVAAGGVGALAAIWLAPSASADPVVPVPPPAPAVPVAPAAAPVAPPAAPVVSAAAPVAPPAEVPHLASPENLPPGSSMTPTGPQESSGVTYLREMWHAVQTQEISGRDALLLLTQRPMSAGGPTAGMAPAPVAPPPGAPVPAPPAPGAPLPPPPAPAAPVAPPVLP